MKLTLRFKIPHNDDLYMTILKYTDAINYVSQSAFSTSGEVKNPVSLHKQFYADVRSRFGLPSQMSCSLFRDVAGKYKANKKQLKKAISFKATHINCVHNRDFTFKNGILSISTVNGRKKIPIHICKYYEKYLLQNPKFLDSVITISRNGGMSFCLIIELTDATMQKEANTMGIDIGLTKLAYGITNTGNSLSINGGKVKDHRNKFLNLRKRLQSKGTRSSKRLLKRLSGRESRYMRDVNYCTVKELLAFANQNNVSHIGIEDLSGIRKSKQKIPTVKRQLNSWAFYQFRFILEYKAKQQGISVIPVDPAYTSQRCSKCGYTHSDNRKTQKHFVCGSCGLDTNADRNASINIETLTRLARSSELDGAAVNQPDVANIISKIISQS